jgi:hypothetical protein
LDKERDDLTAEEIAEAESEITRLGIIEKYEKKRTDAIEAAAVIERRINRDLAIFNRELAVDQAEIDREAAKASLGWFARGKKAEVDALYSELIAKIAATPLPALASGGIALPSRGGSTVQVAEAGVPELILPLDRLDSVLSQIPAASGGGTDGEGDIHLVVNMDSEPILSKIFPATRDRRVLIDANAVVS